MQKAENIENSLLDDSSPDLSDMKNTAAPKEGLDEEKEKLRLEVEALKGRMKAQQDDIEMNKDLQWTLMMMKRENDAIKA